ncbi:hypothetical protein HMPREF3229_00612 [Peptoniphilus harei]|uniref:Uncharacterized protein n=1 Tax=Peptoniphilus harei TaxID=54005 RepID=A0A133PQU7_9FIRM|nr:hypothetical protein HMPREF3229_00612 [Peptoniphilus harei]
MSYILILSSKKRGLGLSIFILKYSIYFDFNFKNFYAYIKAN